jgi:hypothetical protein
MHAVHLRDDQMVDERRASGARSDVAMLWGAFGVQVAGRLLDFWWHATHDEFETGADQLQAHWLVWLGTALVLAVAVRRLRSGVQGRIRAGYLVVAIANAIYVPIAVAHFIQHQNLQEVDWAHAGLGISNVLAAIGVLYVGYVSSKGGALASEQGEKVV